MKASSSIPRRDTIGSSKERFGNMATQYDSIVAQYNDMRKLPGPMLETYNMQQALAPYIQGASVLDLACGTGHYTRQCISWGASFAVGVDISEGMVSNAKASYPSKNITFLVADCSKAQAIKGGPFDIIIGPWFLNYAASGSEMANMFRNTSVNLKEGGRFFGIAPPPNEDPLQHVEATKKSKPRFSEYMTLEHTGNVEDGISVRLVVDLEKEQFSFENFILRGSVYERSARQGGLNGKLEWIPQFLPEDISQICGDEVHVKKDESAEVGPPHYAILMVEKGFA
ncbi:MAG: hypothetical protein Q9222_001530 [Ikaeria aurantiellina]